MAVTGFIALCIVLLYVSFFAFVVLFNSAGQWNIGGAPNSFLARVGAYVFFFVVGYLWWLLFHHSPFVVSLQ